MNAPGLNLEAPSSKIDDFLHCALYYCNEYVLDGSKLAVVDFEKDLGLLISKDLKWDEQVKSSLGKANQTIAWITRNVICKSKEVMKKIYTCLIRPHLEYCVIQLWSPVAAHGSWG